MRFSTMAILALSADWATAARINGVIGEELEYPLTKNRELKAKGAKKAKAASKKPASCDVSVSGTSSKSSKKCANPTSVECGKSYAGTVTLTTGLFCSFADFANVSPPYGIIMDGLDAVLDCAGNDVVVDASSFLDAAIVLRNGATAMNCQVHSGQGNGVGVLMDEGDATLIDSHIYNKFRGVSIVDDGCRTLTNVRTSDNEQFGVFIVGATGTIVMTNLEANGNGASGVYVNVDGDGDLDLVMDGAKLNSNGGDGLSVTGNADVELFGTVRAIGNGGSGIGMNGPSTLTANGKLQASSNTGNGIQLFGESKLENGIQLFSDESELVIAESGTVIACGNGEDIDDDSIDRINDEDGLLISGVEDCAASAPPNQAAAECKLE